MSKPLVMPSDTDLEASLLGALLIDHDAIDGVSHLPEELFYNSKHRLIFRAILQLHDKGVPPDFGMIVKELIDAKQLDFVGGVAFLLGLQESESTGAYASHYADALLELHHQRTLMSLTGKALQESADRRPFSDTLTDLESGLTQFVAFNGMERGPQEYRSDALDLINGVGGLTTGFIDLDRASHGLVRGGFNVIAARPSMGKALWVETPIPTPGSYRRMGDIQPGDFVFGSDGKPTRVLAVTETMHNRPCYEVTFDDGSSIIADEQHEWTTHTRNPRKGIGTYTTLQISQTLTAANGTRNNHAIPVAPALQHPERDLPLDPYLLGVWLGDGTSSSGTLTIADRDVSIVERLRERGHTVSGRAWKSNSRTYRLGDGDRTKGRDPANYTAILRKNNLLNNKHIPEDYQVASPEQRLELLRGLIDTDGYVNDRTGWVELTSTDKQLAADSLRLVNSLGFIGHMTEGAAMLYGREVSRKWRITFRPTVENPVVTVDFKRSRLISRTARSKKRVGARRIVSVEAVPSVPVKCIEVAAPDHLYLAGEANVATHNSSLMRSILRHRIEKGDRVALFSIDQSGGEIYALSAGVDSSVSVESLRTGRANAYERDKFTRALDAITDSWGEKLVIRDSVADLSRIMQEARRQIRAGATLIAVDHLQSISINGLTDDTHVVSNISRAFKALSREFNVTVLLLSQLGRSVETDGKNIPSTSNLLIRFPPASVGEANNA